MDDYNRGGHSKYSMKVHLIFVTKYRKKIFKFDKRADDVKQFLMQLRNMVMKSYKWKLTKTMCIYCLSIAQRYLYQIL